MAVRRRSLLFVGIGFLIGIIVITSLTVRLSDSSVSRPTPSLSVLKEPAAVQPPQPKATNYGLPVRLKIPKLAVDASITYLGLAKTGDMATPANIADVGWYKHGSLPGNKGSAVLAGHVKGPGQPGVFVGLDKLREGDIVQIIDSNGTAISFTVKVTRTYSEDAQPTEVFDTTGAARLALITCSGAWDNTRRSYLERLVVFADKSS